jgi:hypothetical protein
VRGGLPAPIEERAMATPDPIEFDAQDTAEVLDETNLTEDGEDIANFDEIVDVYDVTTALGDGRDVAELDEDDFDASSLDDEDTEEDEDVDDRLRDELEDEPEDDDLDPDEIDEEDGITRAGAREADVQFVGDLDRVTDPGDDDAEKYESNRLSDEELRAMGFPGTDDQDQPGSQGSGASPDDVADERHPRQEELLDEGLEESFPASDPVSVKRIT